MTVTRREFIIGTMATALFATTDAAHRAVADVIIGVSPVIFLPMIMKSGIDNRLWVVADNAIIYLDLIVDSCNMSGECIILKE